MKRAVHVFDQENKLLRSYTVTIGRNYVPADSEFIAEAKKNARDDRLVPEQDLSTLRYDVLSN